MRTGQVNNSNSLGGVFKKFINPKKRDSQQSIEAKSFAWLQQRLNYSKSPKIHDYRQYKSGVDYFFDIAYPSDTAMMTGHGTSIKARDYFLLSIDGKDRTYQVQEVDYYAKFSDIWIVSLKHVSSITENTDLSVCNPSTLPSNSPQSSHLH